MFKAWLYLIESGESPSKAYDRIWKPRFDKIEPHRRKDFAHLFPNGDRIYFPIKIRADEMGEHIARDSKIAVEVIDRIFKATQIFSVKDWKKGLAADGSKNTWKIAKALNYIGQNTAMLERVQQNYGAGLADGAGNAHKMSLSQTQQLIKNARERFMGLKIRLNPINDYLVVISMNTHDIAKMSTGRNWESCRTLSLGEYGEEKYGYTYADITKELLKGGLIAYLVEPDDKEIKRPISRMMIRRYEEELTGDQFLACTDSNHGVYGVQTEKLAKFVQQWLKKIQKTPPPGFYKKQGGKFVSPNPYDITVGVNKVTRSNAKKIIELLKGYNKKRTPGKVFHQFDNLMYAILTQLREQGLDSVPKSFWKEYKKLALTWGQRRNELGYLMRRNPDAFTFDEILSLDPSQARDLIGGAAGESLYQRWGDQEGEHWRDRWKEYYLQQLKDLLDKRMGKLNVDKLNKLLDHASFELARDGQLLWKVLNKTEQILNAPIKRNREDMAELVKHIISGARYGWDVGYGQQTEVPKKQILQSAARITAAGQHYLDRRFDQYDVQSLIKDLEEQGIKIPHELEDWRDKKSLFPELDKPEVDEGDWRQHI